MLPSQDEYGQRVLQCIAVLPDIRQTGRRDLYGDGKYAPGASSPFSGNVIFVPRFHPGFTSIERVSATLLSRPPVNTVRVSFKFFVTP
tara:strand:+ start:342 stop:605 length:264 start_codon:yes stop_codon:yes gene_type:complete